MSRIIAQAYSTESLNDGAKTQLEAMSKKDRARVKGICGDPMTEGVPEFATTQTEKVINNEHNAWIVLGRDRWGMKCSGYGGRGDTHAGAIDIVVGRMASAAASENSDGETWEVNPNFRWDSARIYISQKTDVDLNFDLAAGQVGSPGVSNPKGPPGGDPVKKAPRSAIALKADAIRIIAREGIKLITRTDKLNSQGGNIQSISGIDIIAGNDDSDLQPMVKGDNLVLALKRIVSHMDDLNGIVDSLLMHQTTFNEQLANHFHFYACGAVMASTNSPAAASAGIKTGIDHLSQTKRSLSLQKTNLANFRLTYLEQPGKKYIGSKWNNTN